MKRVFYCGLYYLSWLLFGLVGLGLNLACACLLPVPGRRGRSAGVRRIIRRLFVLWTQWFRFTGVLDLRWVGFEKELPRGTVYVANHPSLVDATFLLAVIPEAFCIFKPSLMRNPVIGPAVLMADYEAGDNAVELVREASNRVRAGQSLLVFPEGTRTKEGVVLNPLRPGFAAIARRAGAPVQLVLIRASRGLVSKGRPWWKPPEILPARLELVLDQRWQAGDFAHSSELVDVVEKRIHLVLRVNQGG